MAALSWVFAHRITVPAVIATFTATGLTATLLLWSTHRASSRDNAKNSRVQRQLANVVGELSALRDETECRYTMQRIWATDRTTANSAFGRPEDPR